MRARLLHVLVGMAAMAMVLGGCAAPSPEEPAPGSGAETGNAAPGADPGEASSGGTQAAPAEGQARAPPEIETYEGTWLAGVHAASAPPVAVSGRAPYSVALDQSEGGLLAEMSWTASSPLSESMGIDVALDGAPVGGVAGTSPLRVTLPALGGEYVLNARASGPMDAGGVFVDQAYTLRIAIFRDGPVDEAFVFPP